MAAKCWKRKTARALGVLAGGLLLVLVCLPLWFPWILAPVAHRLGISYGQYHRAGYGRLVLLDVVSTNASSRFAAGRVEVLLPTFWLWQDYFAREPAVCLRIENWKLEVSPAPRKATAGPVSTYTNFQRIEKVLARLGDWVPNAVLSNGAVRLNGRGLPFASLGAAGRSALQIQMPTANWLKGNLSVGIEVLKVRGSLIANIRQAPYRLDFNSDSLDLHSTNRLLVDQNSMRLQSHLQWLTNRVDAEARFSRAGLWPEEATLRADAFRVPAEPLGLDNYQDISGSVSIESKIDRFSLRFGAAGEPRPPLHFPRIDIAIEARGGPDRALVEVAKISTPWLRAEVTPGTEIRYRSPFLDQEAVLKLAVDLRRQPWLEAAGTLNGVARLRPAPGKFPDASFSLSGTGVSVRDFQANTLSLEGAFAWPWLTISNLALLLPDASTASAKGQFEVRRQFLTNGNVQAEGTFGRQFLPEGWSFTNARLNASFSGPLKMLAHTGTVSLGHVSGPALHPLELRMDWAGQALNLDRCRLVARTGNSSLETRASVMTASTKATMLVNAFTLERNARPILELDAPCEFSLVRTNPASRSPQFKLSPFHWRNGSNELRLEGEVDWPASGRVRAAAHGIDLSALADFLKGWPEGIKIEDLGLSAGWTNGPVALDLALSGGMVRQGIPFGAQANVSLGTNGLNLQQVEVTNEGQPLLAAHGLLPLTFTPRRGRSPIHFLQQRPLELNVLTRTNAIFWQQLASWSGLALLNPDLQLNLSGSWDNPRGQILFDAREATFSGRRRELLKVLRLEKLHLAMEFAQQTAKLKEFNVQLNGQPATLSADLPLEPGFWERLATGKLRPNWEKVSARLKMQNAQLAAFVPLFPKIVAPEGSASLEASLAPGGQVTGELTVIGASTPPLGTFGAVRNINAQLKFLGRSITLRAITASIGGAPLGASGTVDLAGTEWLHGQAPPFRLDVHGKNVPLARNPDWVVRSDIDATITNTPNSPAVISGQVRLHDSFYLRDLKDLLPGGLASPASRPPYFSIEAKPFAEWRLNLALTGDRFMRVNSPLFRGAASADLKLTGTLREPLALGHLRINSGLVQFPFANLEVTQGLVTLTSENPYRPQLLVTAASRRAGYDVKMELTGPADAPLVQFTSTPPLSSEQIVLMVTTGEPPRSEYTLSPQQRAQTLALYLGKNVLSKFGLGQSSDRLSIQSGENISETGNLTYRVEYKLSSRWYLVGEYDRFNALNVGFKWTIYSK